MSVTNGANGFERVVWTAALAGVLMLIGWNFFSLQALMVKLPIIEERQSVVIEHLKALDTRIYLLREELIRRSPLGIPPT